ncbi:MAG: NAD(P)H-dependent oxidoreductase [Rhizobiaceae bacterium]|nr:NAD(P)H-dependent oxidoreductase [Rhizobiaceae bacterium]
MTNAQPNILKIDSSSRHEGSASRQLATRLVNRITAENLDASIISRDVSAGFPIISEDWIGANFTPRDERNETQNDLLKLSDILISELHAADILVIGVPIYNFGVPAALKTWIDLICRVGETFHYTEAGPEGLLTGKRAVITVASGGVPVGSPADHATSYLTQVLGFVGITDVTYISATGLATDPEAPIHAAEAEIDALDLKTAA